MAGDAYVQARAGKIVLPTYRRPALLHVPLTSPAPKPTLRFAVLLYWSAGTTARKGPAQCDFAVLVWPSSTVASFTAPRSNPRHQRQY